jgi:hypothetical protein
MADTTFNSKCGSKVRDANEPAYDVTIMHPVSLQLIIRNLMYWTAVV